MYRQNTYGYQYQTKFNNGHHFCNHPQNTSVCQPSNYAKQPGHSGSINLSDPGNIFNIFKPIQSPTNNKSIHDDKLSYHYNLLSLMRSPKYHSIISFDAKISAFLISTWCICNILPFWETLFETTTFNELETRKRFNNLILFLITMLIINKDLILCNGQSCLPMLLLFNFTVRFMFEYLINFELSWNATNNAIILCLLFFLCQRFMFNFITNKCDIHWDLMRCQLFYRGDVTRWILFVIYCFFSSLMIFQLTDVVCLSDSALLFKNCHSRAKFIGCDIIIVFYCIMVFLVWNRLKYIDSAMNIPMEAYRNLSVDNYHVAEIFVFVGVLCLTSLLYENIFSEFEAKEMILQFTVVVILIINFLLR